MKARPKTTAAAAGADGWVKDKTPAGCRARWSSPRYPGAAIEQRGDPTAYYPYFITARGIQEWDLNVELHAANPHHSLSLAQKAVRDAFRKFRGPTA